MSARDDYPILSWGHFQKSINEECNQAMDEIDRLRAEVERWRTIARNLYYGLGKLEDHTPGGFSGYFPQQLADGIEGFEEATPVPLRAMGRSNPDDHHRRPVVFVGSPPTSPFRSFAFQRLCATILDRYDRNHRS